MLEEKLLVDSSKVAVIELGEGIESDLDIRIPASNYDDPSNAEKPAELYKSLHLNGSESFTEMFIEISKNKRNEILKSGLKKPGW